MERGFRITAANVEFVPASEIRAVSIETIGVAARAEGDGVVTILAVLKSEVANNVGSALALDIIGRERTDAQRRDEENSLVN